MAYISRLTEYEPNNMHTNRYYNEYQFNPYCNGEDDLPNCTTYVFGRWYEISDTRPRFAVQNAYQWYGYTQDGYNRTQTPELGYCACWSGGFGNFGHVGVVEQINRDGNGNIVSIVTSNSAYLGAYFYLNTLYASNNYYIDGYTFQGFIENPDTRPIPPTPTTRKLPLIYYLRKL